MLQWWTDFMCRKHDFSTWDRMFGGERAPAHVSMSVSVSVSFILCCSVPAIQFSLCTLYHSPFALPACIHMLGIVLFTCSLVASFVTALSHLLHLIGFCKRWTNDELVTWATMIVLYKLSSNVIMFGKIFEISEWKKRNRYNFRW